VKIDRGTTKKKNRPHQPTIKFTGFLPTNFLPLPAPPEAITLFQMILMEIPIKRNIVHILTPAIFDDLTGTAELHI